MSSRKHDRDRDMGFNPIPNSLAETLRGLLGQQVQVATSGGNLWTGQVGAVIGNILVLSGAAAQFIDITDITAITVIPPAITPVIPPVVPPTV